MQASAIKFVTLQFEFRTHRNYEKRTVFWYIVTSLLLELLKQHLIVVTLFGDSKSLYS